jgi:hypothetical protein
MRKQRLEDGLQMRVLQVLHERAIPECVFWHTPNGGWRAINEAKRLKTMGVLSGLPDIFVLYKTLFGLELKVPGGVVSGAQQGMQARLRRAGAVTAVAFSFEEAVRALERWELLN